MQRIAALLLALVLGASVAQAQDRPFNWTGLYVGAHLGHGWADWSGKLEYDPGTGPMDVFNKDPSAAISGKGWNGGGQIGFNKQFGNLVLGVEVDGSWGGADGDGTFIIDPDGDKKTDYTWRIKTKVDAFGTARVRAGIANGPLLLYATGGLAFARTSADLTVTGFPPQGFTPPETTAVGSATENHLGWALGGGAEWNIGGGWSLKAEYLYLNLGSVDYRMKGTAYPSKAPCAGPISSGCSFPHTTDSFNADLDMHVVRAGLNYRF